MSRLPLFGFAGLCLVAAGCTPDSVRLVIDLQSDLAPGAEVFAVRLELLEDAVTLDPVSLDREAPLADPGVRIAEFDGLLPSARRTVRLTALDLRGEPITFQDVAVSHRTDRVVTVVLTRDCLGIECPGAGESAATRCLGARCIEPDCLSGNEPSCPDPECTADTDCTAASACITPRCVAGTCLESEAESACDANTFCNPEQGCVPTPVLLSDDDCPEPEPYVVEPPCSTDCAFEVVGVSASHSHTCAVTNDGRVFCFGSNAQGELGVGDTYNRVRPAEVSLPPARAVYAGDRISCALLQDGVARCWGRGSRGGLGNGSLERALAPSTDVAAGPWSILSAQDEHVCGIDTDGALFCWGSNDEGQCGQGSQSEAVATPVRVGTDRFIAVGAGQGHTCAIRDDGTLHCWGRNTAAQLGLGEGASGLVLEVTQIGTDNDWVALHAAQSGNCAIKSDATVHCWGREIDHAYGFDMGEDRTFHNPTMRPDGADWLDVQIDNFHGCGLRGTDAWCWGRAIEGQLGLSQLDPQPSPILVTPMHTWQGLGLGRFSTYLIRDDGALFGSGVNCGRLGNGALVRSRAFEQIVR